MGSCYSSKATEQTRKRSESSLKTLQQTDSNQIKSNSPETYLSHEKHLASFKVAGEEGAKSAESASITFYDNNSDNSISEINLLNQLELILFKKK